MTATATRSRRHADPEQPQPAGPQPEQTAASAQPEQPADKPATITELNAALRDALNAGDVTAAQSVAAQIEAASAKPAPAPKGRTSQHVKRLTAQAIVDALAASLDQIIAGPQSEPFTDAEREIARAAVAGICSYLPGAKSLTWPESFAERTVLKTEKPSDQPAEPPAPSEQPAA